MLLSNSTLPLDSKFVGDVILFLAFRLAGDLTNYSTEVSFIILSLRYCSSRFANVCFMTCARASYSIIIVP